MQNTGSEIIGTVNHMKKNGTFWVVMFGLIAGLILLIIGGGSFFDGDDNDDGVSSEEIADIDAFEYKAMLEGEIVNMCKGFSGVDGAYAFVRVGGGGERIYATDKQYSNGGEREEYVIIGSGSSSHPLYLGQSLPEILGIGVIVWGDSNKISKSAIESMLSSAYGVAQNKVCVQIN